MNKKEHFLKIIKKLEKEKKKYESNSKQKEILIKSLKNDIKLLSDKKNNITKTVNLLKSEKIENISFIYKKESKNQYVKARFYWNRKQREFQIGSIPKILNLIKNEKLSKKEGVSLNPNKIKTWDIFLKNKDILKYINRIATSKIKNYILTKISNKTELRSFYQDIDLKSNSANNSIEDTLENKRNENNFNKEWYTAWGDKN